MAVIAVLGLSILGTFAVGISLRGWRGANAKGESPAFGIAGTFTSIVGLCAWIIAGADLLLILGLFR